MAIAVRAGTFTANTATGNQVVSLTTGGNWPASTTPKLVMFFATGQTADGTGALGAGMVGAATSSTAQWVLAQASDGAGAAAVNAGTSARTNACIVILSNGTPTVQSVATFVSFGADQFTINWTTQTTPPTGRDIFYIAYGGADITNVVAGNSTIPTATGNQAITPTGFTGVTPDAIITAVACQAAAPTEAVHSHFGLGFATRLPSTAQGVAAMLEVDASLAIDTLRLFRTDACVGGGETSTTTLTRGSLQSWDANGFTINWLDANATASHLWFYVAIKGGSWRTGVETENTTNAGKVTSLGTGFTGITPKGGIFVGSNGTADTATTGDAADGDCLITMGVSDGTNEGVIGNVQINGANTSANSLAVRYQDSTKGIGFVKTPTTTAATVAGTADVTFQSGQFTATWASTDAVARRFLYLAAGDAPPNTLSGGGTVPVPIGSTTGTPAVGAVGTALTLAVRANSAPALPAGMATGQYTVTALYIETSAAVTTPTGYTLIGARVQHTPGNDFSIYVAYRKWQAGDAAPTWTHAGVVTQAVCLSITGADQTTFLDPATPGTGIGDAATAHTSAGVTTTAANSGLLMVVGNWTGVAYSAWSSPLVEVADIGDAGLAFGVQAGAGASGTKTATAAAASDWAAMLVGIKAAPGGGLTFTPSAGVTLSGSGTIPVPAGSGTGLTNTNPVYTLSGGGTVPVPSGSGTGLTNTNPVYTLSGSGTVPVPSGSGTGLTFTVPVYTLSGSGTVPAPSGSGTGLTYRSLSNFSGTGTVPVPSGSGTGLTVVNPTYTISGSGTLPAPTGSGTGLVITNPSYTLSGSGTVPVPSGSGAGLQFASGIFILSGNGTVPAPSGSGTGLTNTAPVYTISGNGTIPAPSGSGTGLTYRSLSIFSGSGAVPAPTGTGTGLHITNPVYTLSGTGTVPTFTGSGAGLAVTAPTFTLSGSATLPNVAGSGAGLTFAVPVYTLSGTGTIAAPAGSGAGLTFTPLIGDGVASGAIATATLVPAYTATGGLMATYTATATLAPSQTATATLVPAPTGTATLAPAATGTATLVPAPTATPTLTPAATATATLA